MRILCTARPLAGHVGPLLPLADAAAARGHDVALATGEPEAARLRGDGRTCFTAGLGADARERFAGRIAELATAAPDVRRAAFFAELFVGIELGPRLADLHQIVERWRPDVLVHDAAEFAAPIAAARAGLPWATAGFGAVVPERVLEAAAVAAAPHWRTAGLEPLPRAGFADRLYLDPFPPALRTAEVARYSTARVRLTPPVLAAPERPAWLAGPVPVLYVTFGTVWNTRPDRFRAVLDAAAEVAGTVVVTTDAGAGRDALGPRPAHVHVHAFVPQATLLPFCTAVVCHGGSGTLLGAAAHGLPQVVLPQGADQFTNGALLATAGAGRMLTGDVAPAVLRGAVAEALADGPLRRAAEHLRDEIDALPVPADAVARIEALAA